MRYITNFIFLMISGTVPVIKIAGKTRANNLIKREVNSIITEETNSASSKVVSSIVKGRRIKNE